MLKKPHNILLFSLAVVDMLTGEGIYKQLLNHLLFPSRLVFVV